MPFIFNSLYPKQVIEINKFDEYTKLTEDHLEKFGIPYHQLIVGYKPSADLYIDDKAINVKDWLKSD